MVQMFCISMFLIHPNTTMWFHKMGEPKNMRIWMILYSDVIWMVYHDLQPHDLATSQYDMIMFYLS